MDYEKEYKSLVAKVKKAHQFAQTDSTKSVLEDILPQLRESEDEKIRKWLVDYFSSIKETVWIHRDITCEQILEWLEKQKEPTKEELYAEAGTTEKEYIANTMKMVRAMREKQKEQKPAEWSEEDERMLSRCIKSIECSKMFAEAKTFKDAKDNEINWLKNRFKFLKSQPKQEWSEGDENALKYIHELISWGYAEKFMDAQTAHDMRKWVNEHISHDTFQNGNSRWKPSEEQMEALNKAAEFFQENHYVCSPLITLYEQLKKL